MKAIRLTNLFATGSLLLSVGAISTARADFHVEDLGMAASATDVWAVTCPLLPAPAGVSVRAAVNDIPMADMIEVSLQVVNPHGTALNATAPDGAGASPAITLANGPGQYLVVVNKDRMNAQGYNLQLDCLDAMGMPLAGLQSWLVQDQ